MQKHDSARTVARRVGISALHIRPENCTSFLVYLGHLVEHLARVAPENHYVLVVKPGTEGSQPVAVRIFVVSIPLRSRSTVLRVFTGRLVLPSFRRCRWALVLCERIALRLIVSGAAARR